jgi:hypothetical protein
LLDEVVDAVTMSVPVAVAPPTSVAVTVGPVVPPGIAKVQLKVPVPFVVKAPLVQFVTVTPSKTSPTVLDIEKPVPDTVTVVPTVPWLGLTVMVGVLTVNASVAAWPPTSVAVTVALSAPFGTANVQLKAPVCPVVKEPFAQLTMVLVANKSEANGVDTENPVPDTVTVAPTGPWAGLTETVGVVTVNTPEAVGPPTLVAVTVVPDVPGGTDTVHVNAPVAPVVKEPAVQSVIVTPSKTSPTALVTGNPVPDTVTLAPRGPWFGLRMSAGVVTVNVWAVVRVLVAVSSPITA